MNGKPYSHYPKPTPLEAANTRITELEAQLEIERMRVVACGVAAMGNTEKSKTERITKDNPYWTASYGDVCRAVDAEIDLRAQLEAAKNQWQPIETAPKGGEEILVMYMHIDTQIAHNGFWLEDQQDPDSTGWWTYLRSEVAREKLEGWRTPTHWMPLPALPAMQPKEQS